MSTSGILIEQTLAILIILVIGAICYKTKLIDDTANSNLSNILLTLVQPVLIFTAFQMDFRPELMKGLIISMVLAFVIHIVAIFLSYILIRSKRRKVIASDGQRKTVYVENEDVEVERLASSYANMGFMGVPLALGIYGAEGVFYVTAYIMAFNMFMWTHGVIMISGTKDLKLKDIAARLRSPSIIAIFLGLIFFAFQIKLPDAVNQALNYIGKINTPLAMLIAGVSIAKTDLIRMFTRKLRNYYMVFIKLLLIPCIIMLMYVWLPIDETVKMLAIMMAATPSTTVGTILTVKYKKNSVLAAEIFAMTTVLCIITIPLIIKIAEHIM